MQDNVNTIGQIFTNYQAALHLFEEAAAGGIAESVPRRAAPRRSCGRPRARSSSRCWRPSRPRSPGSATAPRRHGRGRRPRRAAAAGARRQRARPRAPQPPDRRAAAGRGDARPASSRARSGSWRRPRSGRSRRRRRLPRGARRRAESLNEMEAGSHSAGRDVQAAAGALDGRRGGPRRGARWCSTPTGRGRARTSPRPKGGRLAGELLKSGSGVVRPARPASPAPRHVGARRARVVRGGARRARQPWSAPPATSAAAPTSTASSTGSARRGCRARAC